MVEVTGPHHGGIPPLHLAGHGLNGGQGAEIGLVKQAPGQGRQPLGAKGRLALLPGIEPAVGVAAPALEGGVGQQRHVKTKADGLLLGGAHPGFILGQGGGHAAYPKPGEPRQIATTGGQLGACQLRALAEPAKVGGRVEVDADRLAGGGQDQGQHLDVQWQLHQLLVAEQLDIALIAPRRCISRDGKMQHQAPWHLALEGEPSHPFHQLLIRGEQQGAARLGAHQMPLAVVGGQRQGNAVGRWRLDHQQGGGVILGRLDDKLQQQLAAPGGQYGSGRGGRAGPGTQGRLPRRDGGQGEASGGILAANRGARAHFSVKSWRCLASTRRVASARG